VETRFLVEAVSAAPLPVAQVQEALPQIAQRSLDERVSWLVDLFDRLERRERVEHLQAGTLLPAQR
jgi:hypothetical protein